MKNNFIYNSLKTVKIIFKAEPKLCIIYIFLTVAYSFAWVLQTFSMQYFFDSINLYSSQKIEFSVVIFSLIFMGFIYLFYHIMDGIDNCYPEILELKIRKDLNQLIFKKIDNLSIYEFEDTKRLEFIEKAINGSDRLIWISISLLDIIFYYFAYFLFISWYLFILKPILAISVIFVFVPCVISRLVYIKMFKNLEDESSPLRRETNYYEKCLTDKQYFKETRLLGIGNYFLNLYKNNLKKLNELNFKLQLKKSSIDLFLNLITIFGYGVIIFMLFIFVMKKEISIGAFVAVLTSITNLYRFMNKLIFERLGWTLENIGSVENFLEFIEEPYEKNNKIKKDKFEEIILKNVNFKYPNLDKNVLEDINLTIKNGETIAIVGENGSGKSTLCKVIIGLYPVEKGEILYDNENLENIDYTKTSSIFQKFCRYEMMLKDNISISEIENFENIEKILKSIKQSGLILDREIFTENIETMLGKEFDGIDLSGGQWQRIAIARGLFKEHNLIILDEPTSAIDPIEETKLYNDFAKICKEKTAILITHRLGSVKLADKIIVLKDGKIVQNGTHNDLIKEEGEYKRLYNSQRKWYIER